MTKLYKSSAWLRREILVKKKKPEQIAKEQDVSVKTIYRHLREFGLMK